MNKLLQFCGVFAVIFATTISFGMQRGLELARKNGWNGKPAIFKRTDWQEVNKAFISNDFPVAVAAVGDGEVKNNIGLTCKKFNEIIRKTNPLFVSMPTFTAHEKDMNDIALFFSWNGNEQMMDVMSKKMLPSEISWSKMSDATWSFNSYSCCWPDKFKMTDPGQLHTNYITNLAPVTVVVNQTPCGEVVAHLFTKCDSKGIFTGKLPCQAEIALLFAALCKDKKAVEVIAPKIKAFHGAIFPDCMRLKLHQGLLMRLMERDDENAFALVVKNDPYNVLNLYDFQDKREKYVQIYRDCGGKTLDELEPKKQL